MMCEKKYTQEISLNETDDINSSMNKTINAFITLLRSAVMGTNEDIDLSDLNWESLYSLAKFHDLAHIVFYRLNQCKALGEGEIFRKFKNQFDMAIYRHIKREVTIEEIREILGRAQIPFVLLKGVVLMDLYPEPWMRTSSDVDVLIKEDDKSKAEQVFLEAGYKRDHEGRYDISFFTPIHFHVELHYTTQEDYASTSHSQVMGKVWDCFVQKQNGTTEYAMLDEMFYFYHVAHMAKHFRNGGNGVRTIIDTWLLNHKVSFDKDKRNALLGEGGLQTFDKRTRELADYWFSGIEPIEALDDFEDFIINGGIYGTSERNIAIRKRKTESKLKYFRKRIFLPYNEIKYSFPILKRAPFLLPFCWVIRWFRLLNPKVRKRAKEEIHVEKTMDASELNRIESLMKELKIW